MKKITKNTKFEFISEIIKIKKECIKNWGVKEKWVFYEQYKNLYKVKIETGYVDGFKEFWFTLYVNDISLYWIEDSVVRIEKPFETFIDICIKIIPPRFGVDDESWKEFYGI